MRQNEIILGDCRPLRYLSVCSGIEAATCAWHPLGWQPWAFSEIERFPAAVLAHHYPHVPNLGDMTKFKDWPDATIDLLVGGTPCQSFSVAGLRKGLADPRGNLMLTYLAIARRYAPRWLVWENVPGVLSSNKGRDFGTFLGGLAELGYGFAYRVLDAQYVRVESHARAVPQRRRRVFVVGYLGDWRRPAAVLFERESMLGYPAPRREAGQRVAGTLTRNSLDGSGAGGGDGRDAFMIPTIARALTTSNQRIDAETETLLVAEPYTLAIRGRDGEHQLEYRQDGTANAVLTPNGGRAGIGVGAIAFDTTQITSPENGSNPQPGGPCHPLSASAHPPVIAFDCKASGRNGFAVGDIAATQRSMGHANSHTNGGGHQAVMVGSAVRRLTPRECERLQGFPDNYTLLPGTKAPDGPRYKALGNSMAVNVMRWIGERIQSVENMEIEKAA
ncbi:DNA cytosine methyltransferase [Pandoraea bronchicola]|uniref:Cytosine-specific methyltransferase n=1 Tax=Pandoraea bronchicola TaxID=2508287 RepID=A0A5E5BZK4_9BURK|nr:DNA (cytosine-5-)-methyltransferase [Pandoraea bronchicola]VVE90766.1 Modification methylase BanI [Pandoraea bronchicola]